MTTGHAGPLKPSRTHSSSAASPGWQNGGKQPGQRRGRRKVPNFGFPSLVGPPSPGRFPSPNPERCRCGASLCPWDSSLPPFLPSFCRSFALSTAPAASPNPHLELLHQRGADFSLFHYRQSCTALHSIIIITIFFFLSSFFVGCFLRKLTRSRGGAGAARSCPPQPGSAPAPRGVAGPLLRAGGRAGERGGNFFRVGWRGEGRGWGSGREVSAPGNVSWQQSDGRFPAGRRVSLRSRPGLGGSPRSAAPTRGERGAAGGRD